MNPLSFKDLKFFKTKEASANKSKKNSAKLTEEKEAVAKKKLILNPFLYLFLFVSILSIFLAYVPSRTLPFLEIGEIATTDVVAPADINLKGIAKADQTVAEIYAKKADLSGKPVKVRGKVVKFSPDIMGKNWLHIQDGSGQVGGNDLTVTTMATAKPGDTVVISGKLTVAKDFGYGYKYDVIVEDAQVTKE